MPLLEFVLTNNEFFYMLRCPDGKTYGRGTKLSGGVITAGDLGRIVRSINRTWEDHSNVPA